MRADAKQGAHTLYPWQIPPRDWPDVARRITRQVFEDRVFIAASGIAFLTLFALLPAMTALVSVYGLVTSPQEVTRQLQSLAPFTPHFVIKALHGNMRHIVQQSGLKLAFNVVVSVVVAVWVVLRAILGIISALNLVYAEQETRRWPALLTTAVMLAIGALLFWVLALVMIVGAPIVMRRLAADSTVLYVLVLAARWLIIAATMLISMTVLYHFAPCHTQSSWQWLSAGSFIATLLWLAGSGAISLYITHGGNFGSAFGSLGLVMTAMAWLFLTAFVFLLGAELNVELRRQAKEDSDQAS